LAKWLAVARGSRALALQLPRATRSSEFQSEDFSPGFEYFQKIHLFFSILALFFQMLLLWRLPGVIMHPPTVQTT